MATAIVCYSLTGNTACAAELAAKELSAELISIAPVKPYPAKGLAKYLHGGKSAAAGESPELLPYSFEASKYDTVVFAFPVWASNIAPPIRTFVIENKSGLAGKRIAALACFKGGGADKAFEKLKALLGIETLAAELVLIDTLNKPSEANDPRIAEFCNKLI